MTKYDRTPEERKKNTDAVKRHYEKNGFEIQKKRKIKDIESGKKVRITTIIKYGLQDVAKKHGLEYKEVTKSNEVRLLRSGDAQSTTLKKKVEAKLNEYDEEISKMVQAKVDIAKRVSKGEPRIDTSSKITWSDLNTFIDQTASWTYATKKGYRGTLKTMVDKIFSCKPNADIANCFNDFENTIKRTKTAKNSRTKKVYAQLGRFYSLPISLSKYIPEFEDRFTQAAKRAYKKELDLVIERNDVAMIKKHEDKVINWKEAIRAREFWKEAAETTNKLKDWMGYTVMSLYTMSPPLRNDYGCVMLVHKEPSDKKRNYYWPEVGAFYLNHFKTMKRYRDEGPIMFNSNLKRVLNDWIKRSGATTWLFTKQNSKDPFAGCIGYNNASSFAGTVKKIASRYLSKPGDPPVSINVLRKSKVTDLLGKSEQYRQKVARLMRHSLKTASFAYKRTAFSEDEDQSDVDTEEDFFSEED